MQTHYTGFAERVNGWICDLREPLAEVSIDRARSLCQKGEWRVVSHRPHGILSVLDHGLQDHAHVFTCVAEVPLRGGQRDRLDRG